MQAAKQFGFEKCPFLGYGYETSLKEDPGALEVDQNPLAPNTTPQIPLKSLSLAYRAYLPPSFRDNASDELLAGKVGSYFIHHRRVLIYLTVCSFYFQIQRRNGHPPQISLRIIP